ncbi:MAG: hypothetical protein DME26_06910 [Verrucomicrobia bacterium]|nr:MAG: hypothetical protein DME26_06910 [Verrucomicrobiota bacterium]
MFASKLALSQAESAVLLQELLRAAREQDCMLAERDEFGTRYTVDFVLATSKGKTWVRSGWIVKAGEDVPRLTTCYVMLRKRVV